MSKVTALRTIRIAERPNLLWLEVETDEGLTGLGEAFRGSQAVEAVIHEQVAPYLLGRDARNIEAVSRHLVNPYVGFHSASAEVRAASAVDMALWDLAGQRYGVPVYVALGGAVRDSIRAYNTCAGYSYNTGGARRDIGSGDAAVGPYDDQIAFMRDAGTLAESLLSEGYTAMKIWPFDVYAPATDGHMITLADLKAGLEPFAKVRKAVGDRIEIMCELHSLWTSHAAVAHLPRPRGIRRLLGRGSDRQDERRRGARRPCGARRARPSARAKRWAAWCRFATFWPATPSTS